MSEHILKEHFMQAFLRSLEETFENAQGIYLDRGTSIFETLRDISAEEASQPIGSRCASIAAHVAHMAFYMQEILRWMQGERAPVDWGEIWRTVQEVSDLEWQASQERLRTTYASIRHLAHSTAWQNEEEIGGALGLLAHNAYHLGEIRHALCTIRP